MAFIYENDRDHTILPLVLQIMHINISVIKFQKWSSDIKV